MSKLYSPIELELKSLDKEKKVGICSPLYFIRVSRKFSFLKIVGFAKMTGGKKHDMVNNSLFCTINTSN